MPYRGVHGTGSNSVGQYGCLAEELSWELLNITVIVLVHLAALHALDFQEFL